MIKSRVAYLAVKGDSLAVKGGLLSNQGWPAFHLSV